MTDTPSFVTTCTEDEEGNVILDIPEELLESMGWGEGTVLDITAMPGRLTLREVRDPSGDDSGEFGGGE
jgi:hypothetical protein